MQKKILEHACQYHMFCLKRWQNELNQMVDEGVRLDDSRMLDASRKCDEHMNQLREIVRQLETNALRTE
jgi:hypothetical protein